MRVSGVTIPKEKIIVISLTYVFGIGLTTSKKVLKQAGIDENKRTKDLTQDEEDKIRQLIEKTHKTEGDLRREVSNNIKRLKEIKSYRGLRHKKDCQVVVKEQRQILVLCVATREIWLLVAKNQLLKRPNYYLV